MYIVDLLWIPECNNTSKGSLEVQHINVRELDFGVYSLETTSGLVQRICKRSWEPQERRSWPCVDTEDSEIYCSLFAKFALLLWPQNFQSLSSFSLFTHVLTCPRRYKISPRAIHWFEKRKQHFGWYAWRKAISTFVEIAMRRKIGYTVIEL